NFPAKHPLLQHLASNVFYMSQLPFLLEPNWILFQLMPSLLFFQLSHRYACRFQLRFGCKALGVKSN
ncbi:hypothetical protein, partial [Clostridium haemolyticum]|uniref:hypothetical protein n=1 Tax=Clostridium haemolyticum TaxID=84025 RepID=UPI001ABAEB1B